ncbi:2-oxyglutarate/Fe(II) oxygenase [Nitzschia inconspicua]|uniref:2-oxyglutarate/Fe(II) oxygenase n=1 Tax=Nitzschia inconspicua TaxID=303405 RepID=A0A9K3PDQ4_9STRA|nr:2-oxyglutarate/Fe(II) oxygenase [Nitzschia inconspicua]
MRSTSISNRWTKRPIVMLLVVFVWSGFIASALVVSSNDIDVDIEDEDEEEMDPDVVIRPYSIVEVGVPQNLAKIFGKSDDNDIHNFSLDVIENKILETETYFQTQVRDVLSPDQVRRCQDYHERCLVWTLQGGCKNDDEFMEKNCAASCQVCDTVLPDEDLCYYLENGPDIWQPGDLDRMFRRIVQQVQDLSDNKRRVEILSSPDSTNITTEEGRTEPGPWILVIDNFLNVAEMERLIELGEIQGYKRSVLHETGVKESYRNSVNSWCYQDGCGQDPVAKTVLQRIYDLTEIPEDYSEDMQMLYYQPGQYYKVHHDYLDLDEEATEQRGNRILTVFLYLNDVKEGGETTFPELDVTVVPKPGMALIWPNVLDSDPYAIDWNTEHEANQVIRGEKYGANVWFHLKPTRKEYSKFRCCKRKRTYLENGPDAWEPGDLDSTFERIVQDPYFKTTYNLRLLSAPQSYQYHGDDTTMAGPWVITLDDFVTPEEASRLVELGALKGYVQSTSDSDTEEDYADDDEDALRTPTVSWCEKKCMKDSLVKDLFARIYNLTQFDSDYTEKMQLLKYDVGQFHKARTDYNMDLDEETENQLGNSILTLFLYLSDVEEGGQTLFPELNLQVSPKLGRVLIWPSVLNDDPAEMDSLAMHESLPVVQGTKFGANVWFRLKPFSRAYKRFTCDDGDESYDGVVDEDDEKQVDGFEDEF